MEEEEEAEEEYPRETAGRSSCPGEAASSLGSAGMLALPARHD